MGFPFLLLRHIPLSLLRHRYRWWLLGAWAFFT